MYLKFYSKRPGGHFLKQLVASQLSIGSEFSGGDLCFEIWTDAGRREPPYLLPCSKWRLTTCIPDNWEVVKEEEGKSYEGSMCL